ncbi:MAG: DUF3857 domain-containing protein [Acidobacteriota bacterium]
MQIRFFVCTALLALSGLFTLTPAEENEYNSRKIPSFLKKDADAVIREDYVRFEVKNEKRAVQKVKRAVTIFSKDKQDYGQLVLWYDKFVQIESLEGRILDANGEEVRELEKGDMHDVSAFSSYSLYEDNRVKTAELYYDRFPYTVEFTYEISYDGYLSFPTWLSQESLEPVEKSRFEVLIPEGQTLRYWTNADSLKPAITMEDGKKLYTWEARNLPLLSKDAIGDDVEDIAAIVRIAPGNFELDGFSGNMETWKDFGLWISNLYKDRNTLPEEALNDVKAIVSSNAASSKGDKLELTRKLYRYMQQRTRYISVQLGIGGYQPFDVKYVHEKGYGDCKALSNYMVTLLKEAGIKAYPVLIRSGHFRNPMISEFPSNQFNHVIVSVPLEKDTMWLECTSQTTPPGYLGSDCENRKALMITETGGVVVQTPAGTSKENIQQRNLNVNLSSFGSLKVNAEIKWTGNQQEAPRSIIKESTPEDREKWVLNSLETPMAKLEEMKVKKVEENSPEVRMELKLSLPGYASAQGSRIFFQPNIMERRTSIPREVAQRLSPVRFHYPYLDVDTVYFTIPAGFQVEALPGETLLKTSFGNFSSQTRKIDSSSLIYTRSLEIKSYAIDAKYYAEYRKFISEVVKSDRAQVVLVK